jgi:hypothetical protein
MLVQGSRREFLASAATVAAATAMAVEPVPVLASGLLLSPRNFDAPRNRTEPLLHKNQVLLATDKHG